MRTSQLIKWCIDLQGDHWQGVARRLSSMLVAPLLVVLWLAAWTTLNADQSDPELPQLYQDLQQAVDVATASQIENEIWQRWLQAPDAESTELLKETTRAMQQRDYREALIISTQLTEAYPEYAEGWNKRATIYYLMGNDDQSVSDIHETLKREPRHFGAISGLGLIFHRRGDLKSALAAFEQILQISPQSINAKRLAEQIRQKLGSEI